MAANNLNVTFTGNATNLVAAANQSTTALNNLKSATSAVSATTVAQGVVMGNVFTQLAEKVARFAMSAISSYANTGDELYKLMKITGGSAEEMSKLKYAADITGVSTNTLTRNFKILFTHLGANDAAAKQFGVTLKNADGTMRSATQILGDTADKWQNMTNKIKAAEMGSRLFGRSFPAMTPLLALGSKGMKELADQAEKMGLVLSGDNLEKIREYNMAHRQMKAAMSGVALVIGNELLPKVTGLVLGITAGITAIKNFLLEKGPLQDFIKGTAILIAGLTAIYFTNGIITGGLAIAHGLLAVGMGAAATVTPILGAAVALLTGDFVALDIALSALGIPQIIMLITALVAGIIWLVRTSSTARDALTVVFTAIGAVIGGVMWGVITIVRQVSDVIWNTVNGILKVFETISGNRLAKALGLGGLHDDVVGLMDTITGLHKSMDASMTSMANGAFKGGMSVGKALGKGLGDAINNFQFPSFNMPVPNAVTGGDGTTTDPNPKKKKKDKFDLKAALASTKDLAKTILDGMKDAAQTAVDNAQDALDAIKDAQSALVDAAKDMVQSTKDMWNDLVNAAADSMQAALDAAKSAQDKLTNLASSVSDAITSGFGITDIFKASYAQWTGPTWFLNMFKQRLSDAKKFVADIKALSAAGLSPALLSQLAQAGPENGLGAAEMMMGNVGMIAELNNLQAQLDATAAEGGAFVGQLIYGGEAASTAQAATSATAAYNKTVADAAAANAAAAAALKQTQADAAAAIAAGQAGVDTAKGGLKQLNNLTVNVSSPATADQIAAEIAWSLATGNKTVQVFGSVPNATQPSSTPSAKALMLGV